MRYTNQRLLYFSLLADVMLSFYENRKRSLLLIIVDGMWCCCVSRLLDVASVQSVSIVVDVSTSAVSLTDDSGCGLRAEVSQLQTTLSLKPPSATSE